MFVASDWYTLQVSNFTSLAYVKWLIWATKKVMLNNISLRFTLDLACSVGWHFAIGNFQSVCFHSQCKQNFIPKFFLHFTHVAETHIRISCSYHFWVTSPFQGGYIIILLLISNICSRISMHLWNYLNYNHFVSVYSFLMYIAMKLIPV